MTDFFDMRSVILGNSLANVILAVIMYLVWQKYRGKFQGLGYWFTAGLLQVGGQGLLLLQGIAHDFISVFLANLFILSAGLVLFYGMELFTSARGRHGLVFLILLPHKGEKNLLKYLPFPGRGKYIFLQLCQYCPTF